MEEKVQTSKKRTNNDFFTYIVFKIWVLVVHGENVIIQKFCCPKAIIPGTIIHKAF